MLSAIAFNITLTGWHFFILGIVLFVGSILALFLGSLPDNGESPIGDVMRIILWPSFFIWLCIALGYGCYNMVW